MFRVTFSIHILPTKQQAILLINLLLIPINSLSFLIYLNIICESFSVDFWNRLILETSGQSENSGQFRAIFRSIQVTRGQIEAYRKSHSIALSIQTQYKQWQIYLSVLQNISFILEGGANFMSTPQDKVEACKMVIVLCFLT